MKSSLISILAVPLLLAGCDWRESGPYEPASLSQTQPLRNEKSLSADVSVDVGALEISGENSSDAYSADLEYDKATCEPIIHYDSVQEGEEGKLSVRLEETHAGRRAHPSNRLRLKLANSIPLNLRVETGVGQTRLSLSGLRLVGLDLQSGVGGGKISVLEPNSTRCDRVQIKNGVGGLDALGLGNLNFSDFEFEGGVGGASLDFTGEWKEDADIRIQIGVGGVTARMPRDIGVRVEAEKHLFSGLHLDGFSRRNSYYYSDNYDQTRVHLSVRVITGVGGFRISWI
jgi:hypothetical protein